MKTFSKMFSKAETSSNTSSKTSSPQIHIQIQTNPMIQGVAFRRAPELLRNLGPTPRYTPPTGSYLGGSQSTNSEVEPRSTSQTLHQLAAPLDAANRGAGGAPGILASSFSSNLSPAAGCDLITPPINLPPGIQLPLLLLVSATLTAGMIIRRQSTTYTYTCCC